MAIRLKGGARTFPGMPLWQGNILVFGILFLLIMAYFLFQVNNANRIFIQDAKRHARLVAGIIGLHAKGTVLSQQVIEEILKTFLGNTTRFVEYLDSIEPFDQEELSAFALESGLAGITIFRAQGQMTEGPVGWLGDNKPDCPMNQRLVHLSDRHLMVLMTPLDEGNGCIITGIRAERIELLQQEIGLPEAFRAVEGLEGISYIRLDTQDTGKDAPGSMVQVKIKGSDTNAVAEVTMPLDMGVLVVGLDASPLQELKRRLWTEFLVFSVLLAVSGALLSWLLYRHQVGHLEQVQEYERRLSRQREEAALGRAAAAIAHEIRNPLNAMAMGLQRLKIEARGLSGEQERIITIVLDSLKRTNAIVTGLLQYARMPEPSKKPVCLRDLIRDTVTLYEGKLQDMGIELRMDLKEQGNILGDPNLLSQVLDNLIRNAVEAQPHGGFIDIALFSEKNQVVVSIKNTGEIPDSDQLNRLIEPYFTTKTRGTGLGLPVCNRIIKAHGGEMRLGLSDDRVFEISLILPKMQGQQGSTI